MYNSDRWENQSKKYQQSVLASVIGRSPIFFMTKQSALPIMKISQQVILWMEGNQIFNSRTKPARLDFECYCRLSIFSLFTMFMWGLSVIFIPQSRNSLFQLILINTVFRRYCLRQLLIFKNKKAGKNDFYLIN